MTAAFSASGSERGVLAPVGPSWFARIAIRPMTKALNPLIIKFAGRRHFSMAAQIQHVGRRSGRAYVTPATAHVHGDVIVVALTFGNQSDWARNVRAAGGCTMRISGRTYHATSPEFLTREQARPLLRAAFSPGLRLGVRLLGVRQFLTLHAEPLES